MPAPVITSVHDNWLRKDSSVSNVSAGLVIVTATPCFTPSMLGEWYRLQFSSWCVGEAAAGEYDAKWNACALPLRKKMSD
jgi:hypothetical protein